MKSIWSAVVFRVVSVLAGAQVAAAPLVARAEVARSVPDPAVASLADALAFHERYCLDCHQGESAEAGLDLAAYATLDDLVADARRFDALARRVHDGEMPPPEAESPDVDQRAAYVAWVRETLRAAACDDGIAPGPAQTRRMNRTEYSHTIRDLLGVQVDVGGTLPSDGAGGEGFDNAAETLFVSPIHAEKYLDAARTALEYALKDPPTRRRLLVAEPSDSLAPREAAAQILERFLPRAFRRLVDEAERAEFLQLFDELFQTDPAFVPAVQATLEAALVSPHFLFRVETPADSAGPALLDDFELASRLSYFLWASMPDDELRQAASEGRLHDVETLTAQTVRMLASKLDDGGRRRPSQLHGFAQSFVEQWLGTRALGREFKPDPGTFPRFDAELEGGMKYEPVLFFEEILADNRSLLDLIDADFTYVNRRLADHYGLRGEFREQPQRAVLAPEQHRGGLLGMGAVLAVSSYPHRTSPVLRGKWVLETLLGAPPPPPPPGVPELTEGAAGEAPQSLRARLEQHRANPACAACHDRIDPLGFGLENYDVLGQWRTESDGLPIDNHGRLPDGAEFAGPAELKQVLLARKEQFLRALTARMLGFALGRGLTHEDFCTVDAIVDDLQAHDYRAHTLVLGIVRSVPFRYKAGTDPALPADDVAAAPAPAGPTPTPADAAVEVAPPAD